MMFKGWCSTMRNVSRTHRVALDCMFGRINLESKSNFVDTKNKLADIWNKGNFTRNGWNHLLCLFSISHFSSTKCSEVTSKRTEEESGEERVTAKSRPMLSLIARAPSTLSSSASESPEREVTKVKVLWVNATRKLETPTAPAMLCKFSKNLTLRPDHLWPELWEKMGKNAKLNERQKWSHEKPKLSSARRLRGIYFIDPEDKEFKETIKNARKKLDTPTAPAMPCKTSKKSQHGVTRGKSNEIKSKFACILEASESTRLRMGETLPNHHEDHIAGKLVNSLQNEYLVHNFIPMLRTMKIPKAKAAVEKECEKLEKDSAWDLTKIRSKERGEIWGFQYIRNFRGS